jgi:FkbM family methyltransferase
MECSQRLNSLGLSRLFALQRKYRQALEISLIDFIPKEIANSLDCVVDVGANIGEWSIAVALLTSAKRIIAFEPVPETFAILRENTRHYPQIKCINSAVGSNSGSLSINVSSRSKLSSALLMNQSARNIFHEENNDAINQIIVPVTTLDDELKEYSEISLVKLDVQGYEPEVIAGAKEVLMRTKVLVTEVTYTSCYKGDMQIEAYIQLIESVANFRLWGITAPKLSSSGQPIFADAVFVRQDL